MAPKLLFLPALVALVLLSSCDLRNDPLLPPNLDPKEYIVENTIRVYSDHLIRSENDDSYLYIPKESIADSALWYYDTVTLRKVEDLTRRDSLAFVQGTTRITDSYEITVNRYGTEILLDSLPGFATLYTGLKSHNSTVNAMYVQSGWRLVAGPITVYPYGNKRCFFDLDGNGDIALLDFNQGTTLQIAPSEYDVQALIATQHDYVYIWFPREYLTNAVQLTLHQGLLTAEANAIQAIYPGFGLNTKVLELQSANSSDAIPIVRYRLNPAKHFSQQWIRLSGSALTSWPGGDETWVIEGDELISFMISDGKYFLATPIAGQNTLELPLDNSFSQLFLQDLWLDLRDTSLPGGTLKLNLNPETQSLIADYFSGHPFTLAAGYDAFRLEFRQNASLLENLPEGNWIEFGFRTGQANPQGSRLFQIWRDPILDRISYKSSAAAYDETHFSQTDSYVYAGYASSGTYLYGTASESATLTNLPCLKPQIQIQTNRSYISWADDTLPCSDLTLEYGAPVPTGHPWLSGAPYNLSPGASILKLSATYRGKSIDSIPENLFLSTYSSTAYQSVANVSLLPAYPKFVLYKASSVYEHNSFVFANSRLNISPAWTGYLIDGALLSPASAAPELALYSKMTFDNYDWEAYLDSDQSLGPGTRLKLTPRQSLTDTYGVFAAQYDLSPLATVYKFEILNNPDFYTEFQPLIRIRQSARTENLLFSVSEGEFYRIYSYAQTAALDGWHFTLAEGHIAFYLAYDAEYAAVHDNAPHSQVNIPVASAAQDLHLSLYQAQFVLPNEFLGSTVPLGSRAGLNAVSGPAGVNALSAYQMVLTNPQSGTLTPNFYNVLTAPRLPYVYIPIPDYVPGQSVSLFYRNLQGETTHFTRVDAFGDNLTTEFILVGNCAVCFVDNPGLFYTTP